MFRAPRQLPALSLLLDDLMTRDHRLIARYLGISERALKRYITDHQAPRPVHLALFWETRWGQSELDAEIFNRDQVQRGHIDALQREVQQLRATVHKLMAMLASGEHQAANDPWFAGQAPLRGADFQRASAPGAMPRPLSEAGLVAVAPALRRAPGVAVDPAAQGWQLGEDQRGQDGPADEHQALA